MISKSIGEHGAIFSGVLAISFLSSFGVPAEVVKTTFTGGDPGEGLNLSGTFEYAVNVQSDQDDDWTVQGVTFLSSNSDSLPAGVSLTGGLDADDWADKPEYGSSADDESLEEMMYDIIWNRGSAGQEIQIDMPVDAGQKYRLLLLFSENYFDQNQTGDRILDITVEDTLVEEDLDLIAATGGPRSGDNPTVGLVWSYSFTAEDTNLDVTLSNTNPIINAFALQAIPEPATVSLLCVCAGLLLNLRAGRRGVAERTL